MGHQRQVHGVSSHVQLPADLRDIQALMVKLEEPTHFFLLAASTTFLNSGYRFSSSEK